jgi:hypothetical protein
MNNIPTLETLADKAQARGIKLGESDALHGWSRSEANARKDISDIILLYMVFVEDMTDYSESRSTIEIDYLVSEFLLGYAMSFHGLVK